MKFTIKITILTLLLCALGITIGTPNTHAQAVTECNDGIDNDGDGGIDTMTEIDPNNGEVRSWDTGSPFTLRGFVNDMVPIFGHNPVPSSPSSVLAYYNYYGNTAKRVCEIGGYARVTYKGAYSSVYNRSGWSGAGGNSFTMWNSSVNNFITYPASWFDNVWLTTLYCADRLAECQDFRDNDGDGQKDFPNDTGCESALDESETTHDLQCDSPADTSEAPEPVESLNVSKTALKVGSQLKYTIAIENNGTKEVSSIGITDPIPNEDLVFNAGASDTSCDQSGTDIVCSDATPLTIGTTRNYEIVFDNIANACGSFSNTATIQGEDASYNSDPEIYDAGICIECYEGSIDNGQDDQPTLIGIVQFTDDAGNVIPPDITTSNNRSAIRLKDFASQPSGEITVPTGATQLRGSFADPKDYSDNTGTCTFRIEVNRGEDQWIAP